jgi:hypothetical protein
VANAITLNPPHLLKKIVPTILMCRRFRENQSERGGKGFTAGALLQEVRRDKREREAFAVLQNGESSSQADEVIDVSRHKLLLLRRGDWVT